MKEFFFSEREIKDFQLPIAITLLISDGHKIIQTNEAFLTCFHHKVSSPHVFLESLLGHYSFTNQITFFPYEGSFFYAINFHLADPYRLHIFLKDSELFKFHGWFHKERLLSLGKLAGEISHELKNPLAGILLYAETLKESLGEKNKERELIEKIIILARRCRAIIKTLLNFGRPEGEKKEWINLNHVIMRVYDFLASYQSFKDIEFEMKLDENLPSFYSSPTQIEQVMFNLLTNAAEAMKGKGKIRIETIGKPDKIIIRVMDTGPGIPKEILPFIFDPFFTTKGGKEGAGLGLAICANIVKHHGGRIEAKNRKDGGAEFCITFPLPTREALREDGL